MIKISLKTIISAGLIILSISGCHYNSRNIKINNQALSISHKAKFIDDLYTYWYSPQCNSILASVIQLQDALEVGNTSTNQAQVKEEFRQTYVLWSIFSAVAIGPLVERRSRLRIDFSPPRFNLVEKALTSIRQADQKSILTDQQMLMIGAPAKGFAVLENLIWLADEHSPDRVKAIYAKSLARDIEAEVKVLCDGFEQGYLPADYESRIGYDLSYVEADFSRVINQWIGGLLNLRWTKIAKPLYSGTAEKYGFPFSLSGMTGTNFRSTWLGLYGVAVGNRYGLSGFVDLLDKDSASYQALINRLQAADKLIERLPIYQGNSLTDPEKDLLIDVISSLSQIENIFTEKIAPEFSVSIGFSETDGD